MSFGIIYNRRYRPTPVLIVMQLLDFEYVKEHSSVQLIYTNLSAPEELEAWIKTVFDQTVKGDYGAGWWIWQIEWHGVWWLRYCGLTANLWFELQSGVEYHTAALQLCAQLSRFIDDSHG